MSLCNKPPVLSYEDQCFRDDLIELLTTAMPSREELFWMRLFIAMMRLRSEVGGGVVELGEV